MRKVSEKVGLTGALVSAFPRRWQEILTLAMFMIASGDPLMYCNDWLRGHDSLPASKLSSQRVSDLMGTLSSHENTIVIDKMIIA
jgi:hypothetical protein